MRLLAVCKFSKSPHLSSKAFKMLFVLGFISPLNFKSIRQIVMLMQSHFLVTIHVESEGKFIKIVCDGCLQNLASL